MSTQEISSPSTTKTTSIETPHTSSGVHRFIPCSVDSTVEDAPGWQYQNQENISTSSWRISLQSSTPIGPVCWKCKGRGFIERRPKKKNKRRKLGTRDNFQKSDKNTKDDDTIRVPCSVCDGKGHIPIKKKEILHRNEPGVVTKTRSCPLGWNPKEPLPHAILRVIRNKNKNKNETDSPLDQFIKEIFNGLDQDYEVPLLKLQKSRVAPSWIPQKGEQLCNLVGSWRILQRIGSHRWTTDDIVTAYVASSMYIKKEITNICKERKDSIRYLDLGCGNGSVLQMVLWKLISNLEEISKRNDENDRSETDGVNIYVRGIEARSEAAKLAKRSLNYNVGYCDTTENVPQNESLKTLLKRKTKIDVDVIHNDFRTLIEEGISILNCNTSTDSQNFEESMKFDLVTGTPPYFQVDFNIATTTPNEETPTETNQSSKKSRTKAIINQGGMPTSIQSAPARCEFRGGIEAYCKAASTVLKPETGIFCVCENYLNHDRVLAGAAASGLKLVRIVFVRGKVGKKVPLFGVYVMKKMNEGGGSNFSMKKDDLSVRDEKGEWTDTYKNLLEYMSIPAYS